MNLQSHTPKHNAVDTVPPGRTKNVIRAPAAPNNLSSFQSMAGFSVYDDIAALCSMKIYFAHQSVGQNIIDGLKDLARHVPGEMHRWSQGVTQHTDCKPRRR